MDTVASQISSILFVYLTFFFQTQFKENIEAPRHWPLWREFTSDLWIPCTKAHLHGKCFHLMTSSCWRSLCSRWDPPRKLQQFCVVSHRLVRLWPIEVSRWAIPRLYPIFMLWPLRHSNQRERENLPALLNGTKTINYNKYVPLFGVNSFDINLENLERKSCTTRQL